MFQLIEFRIHLIAKIFCMQMLFVQSELEKLTELKKMY